MDGFLTTAELARRGDVDRTTIRARILARGIPYTVGPGNSWLIRVEFADQVLEQGRRGRPARRQAVAP